MPRRVLAMLAAVALLLAVSPPAQAAAQNAAAQNDVYVALGDSAAAGPLIPDQVLPELGCWRSTRNYAHLTAQAIGARTLRDVTCSGAKTTHMYQSQSTDLGSVAPQLNAVTADTTLVTVQIGANDVGLTGFIEDCLNLLPPPVGDACNDDYIVDGQDSWRVKTDALRPRLTQLAGDIRARAPQARIFVVGYATYAPPGGCYPRVPIIKADANYIRATLQYFNRMLAEQAAAAGVGFIDLQTPSVGHDPCTPPGTRWIEPYVPASAATPFHPNALGMRGFAAVVTAAVSGA
ncbi:SGNH/GDSL hydrolase family protein [Nonomuraea wenchangensis]|uniref:GDSL-like Lipase/Acylhydrolase family protein n=1 Tax=Nonomuraea wenchangensis TaxID=568860 RepID=A0A1I0LSA1_9ACTN|nr:SGNH/GDSL hydrolase family protein [Nonomuraea wenchangensis]SEU44470.1 GDSL-like Lipase/Acylhydrolase family protein [Nonomuraea wenchangensis]